MKFHIVLAIVTLALKGLYVSSYTPPFYNWPLAPNYVTAEIAKTTTAQGDIGCFSSATGHPSLNYSAVKLTGSSNSYLEFMINSSTIFNDFSIVLYVLPQSTNGIIFHHKATDPNKSVNTIDIMLLYNTTTIGILAYNSSDNSAILSQTYTPNKLTFGTWNSIALVYDYSSQDIFLHYEPNTTSVTSVVIVKSQALAKPGMLRIGKSFYSGYTNLQGSISCLHFYDGKFSKGDFDTALTKCLSSTWPSIMPAASTAPCNSKKGGFTLALKNKVPTSNVLPLQQLSTSSRVRCADWCSRQNTSCISFAIKVSQSLCKLYSSDESFALVSETGTDYYISSTVNCC